MRPLVELEFLALFGEELQYDQRHYYSDTLIDVTNSAFIYSVIEIILKKDSLEGIQQKIATAMPPLDDFRFDRTSIGTYPEVRRRDVFSLFPFLDEVEGAPNINNPKHIFELTRDHEGNWLFGKQVSAQDKKYLEHKQKPRTFSSALSSHFACALVSSLKPAGNKFLDACSGTGTVLLEACHAGLDVTGLDVNENMLEICQANIEHFGYQAKLTLEDSSKHQGTYNSAIIDFPYGFSCSRDLDNEHAIISNLVDKVDKAIFLTGEDQNEIFLQNGYTILYSNSMKYKNLDRYICYVQGRKQS